MLVLKVYRWGVEGGFVGCDGFRYHPPRTTHNAEVFLQANFKFKEKFMTEPKLGFIHRSQEVDYSYCRIDHNKAYILLKGSGFFIEGTGPHRSKYFYFGGRFEALWGRFDEATKIKWNANTRINCSGFRQLNIYLIANMDIPLANRLNFKLSGLMGLQEYREYPGKPAPEIDLIANTLVLQLNFGLTYKLYIRKQHREKMQQTAGN